MRLTGGCEATVVRGLRWQARGFAGAEWEPGDRSLEGRSVLPKQAVMPLHPTFPGFEDAEALIFVRPARDDGRLLSYHPFTDHLGVHALTNRIVNQPPARQQLRRQVADILDANEVREYVVTLRRLRVIAEVDGAHCDANSFRLTVEKTSRGHGFKLAAAAHGAPRGAETKRGAG